MAISVKVTFFLNNQIIEYNHNILRFLLTYKMHTSPAPIESTCGVNPWPVAPAQQRQNREKILYLQFDKDKTADFFSEFII